ncbi:hypothetical protein FS749_008636 [Ceratobasidium sp. UAMH 11750]|nr:hypothetical protein FS749_008636 [Ceratobasidium sp. UAMH 11750]
MFIWDNVNFDDKPAEQRIKNAGSFESGTAATVVELHPPPDCGPEAIDKALDLDKYLSAVENAPDLKFSDVMPTPEDEQNLRNDFVYETINILVEHAGELFKRFKKWYNSLIDEFNRNRFGARNAASHVSPSPDNDDGDGNTGGDQAEIAYKDATDPQTQDSFDVVVDNGDGEGEDPFDFD